MDIIKNIIEKVAKEDRMLSSKEFSKIFHICESEGISIAEFSEVNNCKGCMTWEEVADCFSYRLSN